MSPLALWPSVGDGGKYGTVLFIKILIYWGILEGQRAQTSPLASPRLEMALYGAEQNDEHIGMLSDRSKPIVFSMAKLDRVKILTGLVECYAKSAKLREMVNLVVVGGYMDVKNSRDREEIAEIEKMHDLIKKHNMSGQFQWIAAQMNRARNGELFSR
ncbi:hypothetical protein ACFX12_012325 [Malus domestica]